MKTTTTTTMESTPNSGNKTRSESVIIFANGKDHGFETNKDIDDKSNYRISRSDGDGENCSISSKNCSSFHSPLAKKFTLIQSPISGTSSPSSIYYYDNSTITSCNVVLHGGGWNSERPLDSSESSINLYDVGSTIQLSPVSENDCPENRLSGSQYRNKLKRGRPKLETITSLMETTNELIGSTIKCDVCKRTFPREKSLQAHLRIHTGERPYVCDFPDCGRKFAQSGQLRTHQRLHTGEKPFVCNFEGCGNRFTHANRRCPVHPMVGVSRDKDIGSPVSILKSNSSLNNTSQEILDWLQGYYRSIKRQGLKRPKESCSNRPFKRKLDLDLDHVSETGNSCQENSALIWKKKRAALQLQAKLEHLQDNGSDAGTITDNSSPVKRPISVDNKVNYEQLSSDRLMGALALMELANCPVTNSFHSESFDSAFNCSLTDVSETHDYHKEMDDLILDKSLELQLIK